MLIETVVGGLLAAGSGAGVFVAQGLRERHRMKHEEQRAALERVYAQRVSVCMDFLNAYDQLRDRINDWDAWGSHYGPDLTDQEDPFSRLWSLRRPLEVFASPPVASAAVEALDALTAWAYAEDREEAPQTAIFVARKHYVECVRVDLEVPDPATDRSRPGTGR